MDITNPKSIDVHCSKFRINTDQCTRRCVVLLRCVSVAVATGAAPRGLSLGCVVKNNSSNNNSALIARPQPALPTSARLQRPEQHIYIHNQLLHCDITNNAGIINYTSFPTFLGTRNPTKVLF